MNQPPFDLQRAHRWFAVEANNRAWDLVEAPSRSPEEVREMLHAAHAAAFHWSPVGTPLNTLRAECLLATAYAVAGQASPAVAHAGYCLELGEQVTDQTPLDRATALGCAAQAHALAGDAAQASAFFEQALQAASALEPGDRALFDKLYPPPG